MSRRSGTAVTAMYGCGVRGRYGPRYGIRVGRWGAIPGTTHPPTKQGPTPVKQALTAKRAPEATAGGWSGWSGCSVPVGPVGARPALYPPSGPGRAPAGPSLVQDPPHGQRVRFGPQFSKVSKNDEVSPKSVQKACVSPYIPKRPPKVTS